MDEFERMVEAARQAQGKLTGVAGEGSILEQISRGEWNGRLQPEQARDLADVLSALTEHARHGRAVAGCVSTGGDPHPYAHRSVEETVNRLLPLNRKERYYTGTVLPMIVASDGFSHLHRLLDLCDLDIQPFNDANLDGLQKIAFYTEYSFVESRYTTIDKARFPNAPTDADTPDIVIVGEDWLLAIEAKMFHNPLPGALNHQMERQRVLVEYWTRMLNLRRDRVRHVLLLPQALPVKGVTFPIVTWEQVLQAYRVPAPAYWTAMLATALDRYGDLVSAPITFGGNKDADLTGQQIVHAHAEGTLEFRYMGRNGGLHGSALGEDIASGNWRTRRYEVRREPLPGNGNWFEVVSFIQATAS